MRRIGLEHIALRGRVWLESYIKLKEASDEDVDLSPTDDFLHIYAKDSSGVSRLYYKDDADVEHDLMVVDDPPALPPGGAVDSIQFNASGGFGGFGNWDGLTLTIPGNDNSIGLAGSAAGDAVTITATGSDDGIPIKLLPKGSGGYAEVGHFADDGSAQLYVTMTQTDPDPPINAGVFVLASWEPSAEVTEDIVYNGAIYETSTEGTENLGSASLYGQSNYISHNSTGTLSALRGINTQVSISGDILSNDVGDGVTLLYLSGDIQSGNVAVWNGVYVKAPGGDGVSDSNPTTTFSIILSDLDGVGANSYYWWNDSQGVLLAKEDETYDSVGQAILALYNPQLDKYRPADGNWERLVLGQWNGNVAEIGTEADGTGTLRELRLLGASVEAAGYKVGASVGVDATITTGDLVGKTITVEKGIIVDYS